MHATGLFPHRNAVLLAAMTLPFCIHSAGAQSAAQTVHGKDGITLPATPMTAVHVVVDDYHGVKVEDPYQWLEDAKSPETRAWIDEQNKYTQAYLSQVKMRPEIVKGLTALERVDEYSIPTLRGGKYFFEKRLADENQSSIYMRDGWQGEDKRLVDATRLSADQNTSVSIRDISENGDLLVYGERQGGADEGSIHVLRVKDGSDLPDVLPSARYFAVSLAPGNDGLYYSLFTHEGTTVWFHKFGAAAGSDT
jgi:prolyl oligopeptidase